MQAEALAESPPALHSDSHFLTVIFTYLHSGPREQSQAAAVMNLHHWQGTFSKTHMCFLHVSSGGVLTRGEALTRMRNFYPHMSADDVTKLIGPSGVR